MAETIFRKIVDEHGEEAEYEIDSAGLISYHEGESADPRMRAHARKRGYEVLSVSRPIKERDFYRFDYILAMDDSNYDRLLEMAPGVDEEAKVHRMAEYCRTKVVDHVPDPYYGGAQGFENVIDMLEDACLGLYESLSGR